MKKLPPILICTILIAISCTKEASDIRLSEFAPPRVTGYELRNTQGVPTGVVGVPNIKLGNESNEYNSEYHFSTYPNPCSGACYVDVKTPSPNETKQLWVVEALYYSNNTCNTTNFGNATLLDMGGTPLIESEISSNNIAFDLSQFKDGYYRVYLKIGDLLLYDNLAITKK